MNICIACHDVVVRGGFLRFVRFAHTVQGKKHSVSFIRYAEEAPALVLPDIEVITPEEAAQREWDAVMLPGSGFPLPTIRRFAEFRQARYGLRVLHVLNDTSHKERFAKVARHFCPQISIANNPAWTAEDFAELGSARNFILEGAVDVARFHPAAEEEARAAGPPFVIGALANKNPAPLFDALRAMEDVELRLIGSYDGASDDVQDLVDAGKLHFDGVLLDDKLAEWVRSLDCAVHTNTSAGWANLGAEALASGVPFICTPHGTSAFAEHEVTALLMETAEASAICAAVERLRSEPGLAARLAKQGRERIEAFSWQAYSGRLMRILSTGGRTRGNRVFAE